MELHKNPDLKIFFNGNIVPAAQAAISIFDHGVLYGDGVFEGLRSYGNKVFKLDAHVRRLFDSAKYIHLDIGMTEAEMTDAVLETIAENGLFDGAYIRIVVTRGIGDLGINPAKCTGKPTIYIIAASIELFNEFFYEHGIKAITLAVPQRTVTGASPLVKSLNYLNNVLGTVLVNNCNAWMAGRTFSELSTEEKLRVVNDGIMLSREGKVTEATAENVFIVRDGKLITPPPSEGILIGITRNSIMEIAVELGIPVFEHSITAFELYTADECFLTGSAAELIPVREIDGRPIGKGIASFGVYSRLSAAFPAYIEKHCTIIPPTKTTTS